MLECIQYIPLGEGDWAIGEVGLPNKLKETGETGKKLYCPQVARNVNRRINKMASSRWGSRWNCRSGGDFNYFGQLMPGKKSSVI